MVIWGRYISVKGDATVLVEIHFKMVQALTCDMACCARIRLEIMKDPQLEIL